MYRFERFTPNRKEEMMEFLESLSIETRDLLSRSGTDPKTLYFSYRSNWKTSIPICLFHDKKIIAICKLEAKDSSIMYLSGFVVREDYQHKGFGSRLVKYALACSLLSGHKIIQVQVKVINKIALSFFKKLGFSSTRIDEEIICLERKLG